MMYDGVRYACRIDGHMNADLYRDILDDELMQTIKFYNIDRDKVNYAQDNDPKHMAKKIVKWFKTNKIKLLSYLAQSPDLNPIKHI